MVPAVPLTRGPGAATRGPAAIGRPTRTQSRREAGRCGVRRLHAAGGHLPRAGTARHDNRCGPRRIRGGDSRGVRPGDQPRDGPCRVTVAAAHGEYSIPALVPGEYEISVEAAGFQRMVRAATVEASWLSSSERWRRSSSASRSFRATCLGPRRRIRLRRPRTTPSPHSGPLEPPASGRSRFCRWPSIQATPGTTPSATG